MTLNFSSLENVEAEAELRALEKTRARPGSIK
jgi:hypothetical protein